MTIINVALTWKITKEETMGLVSVNIQTWVKPEFLLKKSEIILLIMKAFQEYNKLLLEISLRPYQLMVK